MSPGVVVSSQRGLEAVTMLLAGPSQLFAGDSAVLLSLLRAV